MDRLRVETRELRGHAFTSALSLCALVGALVGATLHEADHGFSGGDVPCAACLHAERLDGAATTVPSITATRTPDSIVDVRYSVGAVSHRIAKAYRPRAPPFIG